MAAANCVSRRAGARTTEPAIQVRTRCPKKTTLKACRIRAANTADKRACQSLSRNRRTVPMKTLRLVRSNRSRGEAKRRDRADVAASCYGAWELGASAALMLTVLALREACRPSCSLAYFQPGRTATPSGSQPGRDQPADFKHNCTTRPVVSGANSFHAFEQRRSVRAKVSLECHYRLYQGSEMKNPTFISELHKKLGAPSSEIVDSLRLLKAFVKLTPPQRYEVLEMAERLANDDLPSSEHPLS